MEDGDGDLGFYEKEGDGDPYENFDSDSKAKLGLRSQGLKPGKKTGKKSPKNRRRQSSLSVQSDGELIPIGKSVKVPAIKCGLRSQGFKPDKDSGKCDELDGPVVINNSGKKQLLPNANLVGAVDGGLERLEDLLGLDGRSQGLDSAIQQSVPPCPSDVQRNAHKNKPNSGEEKSICPSPVQKFNDPTAFPSLNSNPGRSRSYGLGHSSENVAGTLCLVEGSVINNSVINASMLLTPASEGKTLTVVPEVPLIILKWKLSILR